MSSHSEDLPIIYGTEFQARALCSQTSSLIDQMPVRFIVGTLSLKNENKIHLLEFHDDLSSNKVGLHKLIFKHEFGEIWDISCSPKQPNLFTTCYSSFNQQEINKKCSIFKFPMDLSNCFIDEDEMTNTQLIHQHELTTKTVNTFKSGFHHKISLWHPEDGDKICTMEPQSLVIYDAESGKEENELKVDFDKLNLLTRENKITKFRWSPHSHCSILGLAVNNQILAKDIRSDKNYVWKIDANSQVVKNLDFNPNAQYYLASCGEDCQFKLWDVRKTNEPVISMLNHSHWVWSVRYNLYHDQLILTCSSDCRVVLSRVSSFASQPFGHLLDTDDTMNESTLNEDEELTNEVSTNKNELIITDNLTESTSFSQKKLDDAVVSVFSEHEDSVYAAEWSNADPWIFASLSYDGRLAINRVSQTEKYNLLI